MAGLSNFVSGIKNLWLGTYDTFNDIMIPSFISGKGLPYDEDNADRISTLYTCIRILSDTISRMPLNVYSDKGEGRTVDKVDYRYPLLHYNPNNWTTQQTFIAALEYWRNIKGNSFARIYRDAKGKVTTLILIPPSRVKSYAIKNNQLYYTIEEDNGESKVINTSEILHFKGITKDGIWGLSQIDALKQNLSATYQGLQMADHFYTNNAAINKYIKSTVSGTNQKAMLEALEEFQRKNAGPTNAGTLAALPPNTELIFDNTISLVDVEFINTMKFNATQIAALYGVPPHMVGILEATKFNNVEQMMLDFKSTTLAAIARMYRQELEFKLLTTKERLSGLSIEFNLNALVEADSTTRINNLKTLLGMGVPTINDICKLEGFETYPEGKAHLLPGNYLSVEQIVNKSGTQVSKTNNTDGK